MLELGTADSRRVSVGSGSELMEQEDKDWEPAVQGLIRPLNTPSSAPTVADGSPHKGSRAYRIRDEDSACHTLREPPTAEDDIRTTHETGHLDSPCRQSLDHQWEPGSFASGSVLPGA